jgi:uncharacterized 2Fe-2S/4Fe-4S cluster protein (DUF4445 family)
LTIHHLRLLPSGKNGDISEGTTLLDAADGLGLEIESICGGRQVCGKCLIECDAMQKLTPPDATEQAYAARHGLDLSRVRLSCAACILGDVTVTVPEQSLARKQVIRKTARNLTIEVDAACHLYYVEVLPALVGSLSNWHLTRRALAEQHDLHDIHLDPLMLPPLESALREANRALTLVIWNGREVIAVYPGYRENLYGLAVDIGSTTIAGHLCNLRTGEVVATASMMNPQVRYGDDIMSRVSYSMMNEDGTDKMQRAVIKALNQIASDAAADISPEEIVDVVLVGNTVMHHILLGINPIELGGAPFTPITREAISMTARDLGLKSVGRGAKVYILPCIAGHVGADNTAVLLAESSELDDDISLIVDIGTNAEILLGTRDLIYSAASPTGPAFEGAQITHGQRAAVGAIERVRIDADTGAIRYKVIGDERWSDELADHESLSPTGICGSGIIEVIVELLLANLIDSSGLFTENPHPALRSVGKTSEFVLVPAEKSASGQEIVVTQQDVRAIQLAKGALYAGVRLLMDHRGVDHVDRIKLAGGFGSYIDPQYAMLLGLIPDCDLNRVSAVGNAAGDGAMIALLNTEARRYIEKFGADVDYIETAIEPRFQDYFVGAMAIPHATDPFPHLADALKDVVKATPIDGRTRRRRSRKPE